MCAAERPAMRRKDIRNMLRLNRDLVILFRVVASCLTAGLLIFFVSAFAGEDLLRNHSTIKDLDRILEEISAELNDGIDRRTRQLGEVPKKKPVSEILLLRTGQGDPRNIVFDGKTKDHF